MNKIPLYDYNVEQVRLPNLQQHLDNKSDQGWRLHTLVEDLGRSGFRVVMERLRNP